MTYLNPNLGMLFACKSMAHQDESVDWCFPRFYFRYFLTPCGAPAGGAGRAGGRGCRRERVPTSLPIATRPAATAGHF